MRRRSRAEMTWRMVGVIDHGVWRRGRSLDPLLGELLRASREPWIPSTQGCPHQRAVPGTDLVFVTGEFIRPRCQLGAELLAQRVIRAQARRLRCLREHEVVRQRGAVHEQREEPGGLDVPLEVVIERLQSAELPDVSRRPHPADGRRQALREQRVGGVMADLFGEEFGVREAEFEVCGLQEAVWGRWQVRVPVVPPALDELVALRPKWPVGAAVEGVERLVISVRRARVRQDAQASEAAPIHDAGRALDVGAGIDPDQAGRRAFAAGLQGVDEPCL